MSEDMKRKAFFLNKLQVEEVGQGWFRLLAPLAFSSVICREIIYVPAGFKTDFASVPRIPMIYAAVGGVGDAAAVIHDYLYTCRDCPRSKADRVFREALAVCEVGPVRRGIMWVGVRIFGWLRKK